MTRCISVIFFFNDTATTEIYTLSLHDALPISSREGRRELHSQWPRRDLPKPGMHSCRLASQVLANLGVATRSEEHTSELQSLTNLVCRLLLEKKKKQNQIQHRSEEKT